MGKHSRQQNHSSVRTIRSPKGHFHAERYGAAIYERYGAGRVDVMSLERDSGMKRRDAAGLSRERVESGGRSVDAQLHGPG